VLLKNYDIEDVQVSCNTTTSIGQISFGVDGKVYTQLTSENLELKKPCTIRFVSKTTIIIPVQFDWNASNES
jgi:hypothetical protein